MGTSGHGQNLNVSRPPRPGQIVPTKKSQRPTFWYEALLNVLVSVGPGNASQPICLATFGLTLTPYRLSIGGRTIIIKRSRLAGPRRRRTIKNVLKSDSLWALRCEAVRHPEPTVACLGLSQPGSGQKQIFTRSAQGYFQAPPDLRATWLRKFRLGQPLF
jgi:hypothetical protein